jgi:L-rhamnose-H+ transport protein
MIIVAFSLVLIAGFFQGTFVLPMTMTKKWQWEHTWATFSLLGMFVFNWILTFIFIPNIFSVYSSVPSWDIIVLILFGAGWGIGAILFGLGMDKLGMALGYPIIMGLIASLGALIPLIIFFPSTLVETKGLVLLLGTALTIVGIVYCSKAGTSKNPKEAEQGDAKKGAFAVGLTIAIFAGI